MTSRLMSPKRETAPRSLDVGLTDPDGMIASWTRAGFAHPPASKHARLEIVNAVHLGHRPGDAPPLAEAEPVPGCGCPSCTGVSADDPARRRRRARPGRPLPVDDARRVPILEIASRLGLGEPVRRGREWAVCCPLHDDNRPSLTLSDAGLWYCFVCAEGGDGLELWQRVRGCSFAAAVLELAGVVA